ncbi:MAG: phosphatase PAP2 family protein [Candidatus Aenigmarchaeota archaeon]|nr:phosphatase PAP2 family protein [Candidatus Aenigmarchaeota archaeon]
MKNLNYKICEIIDRKPFRVFAVLLLILNLSGLGDANYLTLLAISGSLLSIFTSLALKMIFKTRRPEHNKYRIIKYGFPSGHAHVIFTIATIYSYYLPYLTMPFFILASFVSASRIKIKAHGHVDLLGGIFLGIFTGLIVAVLAPRLMG